MGRTMRTSIAIAGVLASLLAGPAAAEDVPATSRVDAVTVFLSGAEVTRAGLREAVRDAALVGRQRGRRFAPQ